MSNISVVIPSYNEEKDIPECLKSLKKQSYKNMEVILVDDGSTDRTIEIAKKTAKKEKLKLKVLKQNHHGPGRARNLGAKNASGIILIFIDADMTFDKDYIKNLAAPIIEDKKNKIVGTTHDYEIAINTDKIYSYLWGKLRVTKETAKDVKIFRAIRRDKFLEMGGFDQKYGYADDQTFWFKYKIKPVVAENTICYHRNPDTIKSTYKQARWIGASWKERFLIFRIPILNLIAVLGYFLLIPSIVFLKSLKRYKRNISFTDKLMYFWSKLCGYGKGIFNAVILNKNYK